MHFRGPSPGSCSFRRSLFVCCIVVVFFWLVSQLYVLVHWTPTASQQNIPGPPEELRPIPPPPIPTADWARAPDNHLLPKGNPESTEANDDIISTPSQDEPTPTTFVDSEDLVTERVHASTVVLVLTGWRDDLLRASLTAIANMRMDEVDPDDLPVVLVSHDLHDETSLEVVREVFRSENTNWGGGSVFHVVNPYRQYLTDLFDPDDFKDHNIGLTIGTVAVKTHWFFAMRAAFTLFEGVERVVYIEDDHVASMDAWIVLEELERNKERLCGSDCFLNLGCRDRCWSNLNTNDMNVVFIHGHPGNTGPVLYRQHWDKIESLAHVFCGITEDNWDIALSQFGNEHLLPFGALSMAYPRVAQMQNIGSQRGIIKLVNEPKNEAARIRKEWISHGLDKFRLDLSATQKSNLKSSSRGGGQTKRCVRPYTDLCMRVVQVADLGFDGWIEDAPGVYFGQFDLPGRGLRIEDIETDNGPQKCAWGRYTKSGTNGVRKHVLELRAAAAKKESE